MSFLALLSVALLGLAVWFFLPKLLLHATISFAAFLFTGLLAAIFSGVDQLQYIVIGAGFAVFGACALRLFSLTVRG